MFDMMGWPNVANLKVLKTTAKLESIDKATFEKQIKLKTIP
jgi:hypothetical protein